MNMLRSYDDISQYSDDNLDTQKQQPEKLCEKMFS